MGAPVKHDGQRCTDVTRSDKADVEWFQADRLLVHLGECCGKVSNDGILFPGDVA